MNNDSVILKACSWSLPNGIIYNIVIIYYTSLWLQQVAKQVVVVGELMIVNARIDDLSCIC